MLLGARVTRYKHKPLIVMYHNGIYQKLKIRRECVIIHKSLIIVYHYERNRNLKYEIHIS